MTVIWVCIGLAVATFGSLIIAVIIVSGRCSEAEEKRYTVWADKMGLLPDAEVKHGHYVKVIAYDTRDDWHRCSHCSKLSTYLSEYCPNCGAKMDEVEEE